MTVRSRIAPPAALLAGALLLTACGGGAQESAQAAPATSPAAPSTPATSATTAAASVTAPVVMTYDGGLLVVDGQSLEVVKDIPLAGYNRVNPAGDDRHVLVSTSTGFRVLDAASATLKADEFKGAKPGHVVRHAGVTVLFADGTGEVTIFDPNELAAGLPQGETYKSAAAHHGVAIKLTNGELVVTLGTEEKRTGIVVLDAGRKEIARNEDCPGVHGEATAKDEAVVIGCEDGVLIYRDGRISKVDSPDAYGRIGNQAGSDSSPVVLGDYKKDPDAELERPTRVSLIDTATGALKLVDLGASYTFRSLARGPGGEALVLGTDGAVHVIDPATAKVERRIKVLDEWKEPLDWQQPRPNIFARDGLVYVSDPAGKRLHAVDLASGKVTRTATLPRTPNELTGTAGAH
ncbi:zinc metallochaperone AztD [Nonomuraea candida]|uniref:zinc metallochaperone AztD n=1 Tax=Nonomuraea candida TaxID=359159 RepID=UPI0005B957B4|nr:zinc metallochaperone AztD [Nonomuraea candida]